MIKEFLANQLKKPSGLLGGLVSKVMVKTNNRAYETIIENMEVQPGDKLYEIGYGPGAGIELIQKSGIPCHISGIDFSELMYREAGKKFGKSIQVGKVVLTYGDFITAEAETEKYNKVFAVNVIYFWKDLLPPFKKIHTMLLPQGKLHLFMRDVAYLEKKKLLESGVFRKYTIGQVDETLKAAGFSKVTYQQDAEGYFIEATK